MESIVRDVRDIDNGDRRALEHVVGQTLRNNQRLVIQIMSVEPSEPATTAPIASSAKLPDWCNVYAGLSEAEIADVEKVALARANLTRPSE